MSLYSVTGFGEIAAGNAAIQAIHSALTSASAVNEAAASAITPPGSEGASVRAVSQQMVSINHFGAMLAMGLEQLEERIGSTTIFGETAESTEALNEASTAIGQLGSSVASAASSVLI